MSKELLIAEMRCMTERQTDFNQTGQGFWQVNDFSSEVKELTVPLYTVRNSSVVYVQKIFSHSRENISINFFDNINWMFGFIGSSPLPHLANVPYAAGWSQNDRSRWGPSSTSPRSSRRCPVPYTGGCSSGAPAGHLWYCRIKSSLFDMCTLNGKTQH